MSYISSRAECGPIPIGFDGLEYCQLIGFSYSWEIILSCTLYNAYWHTFDRVGYFPPKDKQFLSMFTLTTIFNITNACCSYHFALFIFMLMIHDSLFHILFMYQSRTIAFSPQCVSSLTRGTKLYWYNIVNMMAADSIAPCVARESWC